MSPFDIDTALLETGRSKPPVSQAATKGGRPQRARMEADHVARDNGRSLNLCLAVENQGTIGRAVYGERECSLIECN